MATPFADEDAGIMPFSSGKNDITDSLDRPTLYIDFLGDNAPGYSYTGLKSGADVPSDQDQSSWQEPNPPDAWKKYGPIGDTTGTCTPTTPGTVFWVGVGIDKMTAFELSKNGQGLTGVELGFYYNPEFVEPYTGASSFIASDGTSVAINRPVIAGDPTDYAAVLSAVNLSNNPNSLNQWYSDGNPYGSGYEIVEAIPDRAPVMENDTQEIIFNYPTNYDMTTANGWKMLYVSLEKKETDWNNGSWTTDNRFLHTDTAPYQDTTHYVMMLPFVLKDYDPADKICFRLSRNASTFSMGGGRDGAGTYDSANDADRAFGAWERETRTPNHNLKEMFNFEGDLNIFTGENVKDQMRKATLHLEGPLTDINDSITIVNKAKLYPSADPSIYVDQDGDFITGLCMGDALTLEVEKGAGYAMSITITKESGSATSSPPLAYTEVVPGSKFTFVMPDSNVDVTVNYIYIGDTGSDHFVRLIKSDPNSPPLPENKAEAKGEDSTGTMNVTVMEPVPPAEVEDLILVATGNEVTVTVSSHPDYKAVVVAKTLNGDPVPLTQPDKKQEVYTFDMPAADVEVTVTYEELPKHYAELSVDAVPDVDPANTAKLTYIAGNMSTTVLNGHDGGRTELGPIPADREVRLDIHLLKDYLLSEIRLYNGDDSGRYETIYTDLMKDPGLTMTTAEDGYLTFTMPDNRVQVHVIFAARRNYTAKLFLQNGESAEMWGNKDGADDGSGPNPAVSNRTDMTAAPKKNTILVWPGNDVTVDLDPKAGYVVESVTITWGSNNKIVYSIDPDTNVTIPDPVHFTMPAADVNVFVKFKDTPAYNATLVYQDLMGGSVNTSYDSTKSGWPQDPTASSVVFDRPTKYDLHQGDRSTAWVQVRPGWYIASVRVVGWDSSPGGKNTGSGNGYPVASLSGNGYNNGNGGRVSISVDQPNEDLTVYVVMKQGKPPVEPEYTLTLRVDDPDNTMAPLANNWAQVTINSVGPQPVPAVSLNNGNNGYVAPNATHTAPITAGQEVIVDYRAAAGYRVTGVSVTPSGLAVVPTYIGSNRARFYMPAGSAVVTVHFDKVEPTDPAPYKATLHIGGTPTASELASVSLTNTASSASTNAHLGTVPAWMGDGFVTKAQADSGRYVTVEVYQGGSVLPWTPDTPVATDSGDGSFIMPNGNVDVYVNFTNTKPVDGEYTLALTAYGPAGTTQGQAGTVDLTIGGTPSGTVESNETPVPTLVKKVPENDKVRVIAKPEPGYVVDRIVYTTNEMLVPQVLAPLAAPAGNQVEEFEMPAGAVGVEVYFRAGSTDPDDPDGPKKHTANIILRMEDNPTAAVDTTVVGDAQFDNLNPGGGYSKEAVAGTKLDVEALARNGYYISKIEITPKNLGIGQEITGVFASQDMDFIMPDADCTVNVYFRKGWPDEAQLWATLRVHGPANVPNNNAQLFNVTAGTAGPAAITAGQSQSLRTLVGQEIKVKVGIENGYKLVSPISVKDAVGTDVPYWWSGSDEISFRMPDTWTTVDVTFEKEDPAQPEDLKATLYNRTSSSTGRLTKTTGSPVICNVPAGASGQITQLKREDMIEITVTGVAVGKVPVALARTASGVVVPLPAWTVASGGTYTTSFAMQDEDVEVYLTETDQPGINERMATLVVSEYGTGAPNSANQASMSDAALSTTTGTVSAVGTAAIQTVTGDTVSIHIDGIAAGYVVRSVEVRGVSGELVALAQPSGDSYTYTMPAENVVAVVTFEKHDPADTLTAQVVVDNAGGTGNNAVIRTMGSTAAGTSKITGLAPGDPIEVCITVQSGYWIQLVTARANNGQVVSVSPLLQAHELSQNVHFYMPNDDTIVFVRFIASSELHKITLDVVDHTQSAPNLNNTAALHTGYTGWSAYINHPATPVTAQGAVNDMVQVKINPQANYYAVVYAVSDDVNVIPVPDLTLDYLVDPSGKTYTFSVPNSDVKVTVHYYPDSVPKPQHKVRLHITGMTYCLLPDTAVWQVSDPSNTTTAPGVMELTVDYLEVLKAKAKAKSGYYVQSAFAKVGNTILNANPGTTVYTPTAAPFTEKEFQFTMQNSDVDVYMVFTDQAPAGPYTASLTVSGPADTDWQGNPVYGAAGSAVLTNTTASVSTNTVLSNQPFNPATDSVTADQNHALKVEVTVNPGYSIDRVVVTPLGLTVTPTSVTTDATTGVKTYTYTMPAADINIDVRIKSDDVDRYKVTLHLKDDYMTDNPTATTSVNKAKVSYTVYELKTDGAFMYVPETQYVCVETEPGAGYYVHHAYAVTANGEVLPLVNKDAPSSLLPLQYPNDRPPAPDNHKAWFKMPAEAVDVFIDFTDTPPTGEYSAIVTVLDEDPTHASTATLTLQRGTQVWSVTDNSVSGSSDPISVNAGEVLTVTLNIASGWTLDSITVTGGVTADVTPTKVSDTVYTFNMPAHDVGVVVKLKSVPVDGYKATLHIVDHSSATGNEVTMKDTVGGTSVNTNNGTITKLNGNEKIETKVKPKPGVEIRSVIATDGTGSHILPVKSTAGGESTYEYDMKNHDVDITVVFDNDDPDVPDMFLAIVEKTGDGAAVAANTATVINTSNPALPSGTIWTGIYGETPKQRLQVDVSTAPGFSAVITAKTKDNTGTDVVIPVLQLGAVGTVTGYLDVPSQLYDNVIITVEYKNSQQATTQNLTLQIVDPNGDVNNTAEIRELSTVKLAVDGTPANSIAGPTAMTVDSTLILGTAIASGHLEKAELIANGVSLALTVHSGSATFRMPNMPAEVVVTLAPGAQTPRPHDNLHDPNFAGGANTTAYINGYLTGQNLGGNRGRVRVPNLYNKDLTPDTTIPAFDEPDKKYEYKLYLKNGESYVQLQKGVDYEVTSAKSYIPGSDNATTGINPHDDTGWEFDIRSLKGESALTELMLKGGVMYITATDLTDSLAESEYVEVTFGPDENRGKFTATLKIVDSSGIKGNEASMTINGATVTKDGEQITKLQGDELIRTQAKPASGARISAVTVTDSGGTRLITEVPPGMTPQRFPYYMTGEDVIITVYFEAEEDTDNPDATHYIAAVSKHGEIAVPGNDATIKNDSRGDLKKGTIWAEGNEGNAMRVTVSVADGYYATIKAYRKDWGTPVGDLPVVAFGAAGPGSFDALFTMPAADVQVEVTFTKDKPDNFESDLTLKLMGDYGTDALNMARMQRQSDKVYALEADADPTTINVATPEDKETDVVAGTLFDLFTSHAADYYVEKVVLKVTTTPASPDITLALDSVGAYKDFPMPRGETVVEVWYKKTDTTPRTPRPYDPLHSEAYNSPAYVAGSADDLSSPTQEGWILATGAPDDDKGHKQVTVLVPTLHDDTYVPISDAAALKNADIATAGAYKFYWYDGFSYQELVQGTDIAVAGTDKAVTYTAADGKTFNGREMVLTALLPGSILEYYIKRGGTIYVTSNATPTDPTTESDYTQVIIPESYTVTLHIVNHSSHPTPGSVSMTDTISTVTEDGKSFGAAGDATIKTTVSANPGVVLRGVIATDDKGSRILNLSAGEYIYTMHEHDVDITVAFDNADDPDVERMYLALVEKTGDGLDLDDNAATITNTTNPALPKGDIWTGIYGETPEQRLQVNVTTANGYFAKITAKTASGTAVPVLQLGVKGTVVGYLDVPSSISENIIIAVNYQTTQPDDQYELSLEMVDPNADAANKAYINTAALLQVNGTVLTAGPEQVQMGTDLDLTTSITTGSLAKVEITTNGVTTILTTNVGTTGFTMPNGNTKVVVTLLKAGKRTPRPHDNLQDPDPSFNGTNGTPYIDGYLKGQNLGDNKALIQVPNLYNKDLTPNTTIPAFDEPDKKYDYKLYLKNGGSYVELVKGVDYDITTDGSYDPGSDNATTGVQPHNDTGWQFRIRSLKGESALTELLLDGGVLYITATDVTDSAKPLAESEYVEVVLPADPKKLDPDDPDHTGYKATLWVVDSSGVSGNVAGMFIDGHTPPLSYTGTGANVDASQGDITGLRGDEIVRTTAKAAAGARISAVTVTDAGGTRLLPEVPDLMDTKRFPYYMTGEDVIITVYFEAAEDPTNPDNPDDTRYIAAVAKYGAIAVSGNEAKVENTTHTGLLKESGTTPHWAEGYEKDKMQVGIGLASGYYAQVEAFHKPSGTPITLPQSTFGPGPYNISADTLVFTIDMPASDVQINVTFVKEIASDLRPYDPNNTGNSNYADHWITSENQGDRLVVVVPELNQADGSEDTEVNKSKHAFHFYMSVGGADAESLANVVTLSHPDPDNNTNNDPYENEIYYVDPTTAAGAKPTKYHGARFVLTVKTDEEIDKLVTANTITAAAGNRAKELAKLLRAIMDNAGTDKAIADGVDPANSGTKTKARLYITHTDSGSPGFESERVDFEIPRYYSLTGELESYAPAHIAELSLEMFVDDGQGGGEYKVPDYKYSADAPYHMVVELQERKVGNGLWVQEFAFKSSKLAGKKYQFVAEKAAHITYKRPEVELATAAATLIGRYDAAKLEFSFDAPIALIAGDIDGNQQVKFRDWDRLLGYMYHTKVWTSVTDETQSGWAKSVYNPATEAYAADLNGDGRIDTRDEQVLMHERNYNKTSRHYNSPTGLDLNPTTVSTFGMRRSMMRMAPRMMTNVVRTQAIEEEDELDIPEWAAQLVREGVRIPMWVIELIRQEEDIPDWLVELVGQERTLPDWAIELLLAGEDLPDWAMELLLEGKELPTEQIKPRPENGKDTYTITSDTVIKPIIKPEKDEGAENGKDDKDTYAITSDTEIKSVDTTENSEENTDTNEPDDKDSLDKESPDGATEEEIKPTTDPPDGEPLEDTPQGNGDEVMEDAENQAKSGESTTPPDGALTAGTEG